MTLEEAKALAAQHAMKEARQKMAEQAKEVVVRIYSYIAGDQM